MTVLRVMRWSLLGAIALIVFGAGAWRLHKSRTYQLFGSLVSEVSTRDSVIALTFDDGPGAFTDSVLDFLHSHGARATFFVTGAAVTQRPATARRIVAEGHELGNHSFSHTRLVLRRPATIRREIESTDSVIRAAGVQQPVHVRPPYGKRLVYLPWYLARTRRTTVMWSLEPDTWFRSADAMADHVLARVRPGSIILLHVELPARSAEREALMRIVPSLEARGFRFVTVSELMTRGRSSPPGAH